VREPGIRCRGLRTAGTALLFAVAGAGRVSAQCRPAENSNESQLLAFYSAPFTFSPYRTPEVLPAAAVVAGLEATFVPDPDADLRVPEACPGRPLFNMDPAPIFVRPRVTFALARGLELEASYVPPIRGAGIEAHIASAGLSWTTPLRSTSIGGAPRFVVRAHGTVGHVRGAFMCPPELLQQTNPAAPCFGPNESRDRFEPNMLGLETAAAWETVVTGLAGYLGIGVNSLRPRYQVRFTDVNGNVDSTRVAVNLTRFAAFSGVTWRANPHFELSGQVYSVPADLTTARLAAAYRFR
jgi:hypothetical protein